MDLVRLGRKGQVSLPKAVLKRLGIEGDSVLLVEASPDGRIVLRPAGVYPIEIYSAARVKEFLEEDRLTATEVRRLKRRARRTR